MANRYRGGLGPLVASLLMLGAGTGCGDGTPSVDTSTTEAVVSGTVKVRGTPATGGEILFNPSNHLRIVPVKSAPIGPDGSFKITTFTGGNEVSFRGEVATRNSGVGLVKEYVEVQSGENSVDFDLMGEGSRPSLPVPETTKKRKG